MKVKLLLLAFISCLIVIGIGCKGDMGDIGPAGPAGPDGPQGPQGQSEFANCTSCHGNSQLITAKLAQWETSVHATGGHFERNNASCAGCHTSQGFLDRLLTGEMTASEDVEDPLPQNCYTCHKIHQSYTDEDWDLSTSEQVAFWLNGETYDLGTSNLCVNCHQARVPSPAVPPVGETEDYSITNKRYGPHHGAQGMMFTGSGGYELAGSESYTNSLHESLIENACVNCHMAAIDGSNEAGGHTFRVSSAEGDLNMAGCVQCHENDDELQMLFDVTQAEITMLLDSLSNILLDKGILNPDDLPYANASNSNPLDLSSLELGVLWNYQYVREDQSLGVHNYKYAKALLLNSIEALE